MWMLPVIFYSFYLGGTHLGVMSILTSLMIMNLNNDIKWNQDLP